MKRPPYVSLDFRWQIRATTPVFLAADIAATMEWYREKLGFAADPFPPSPPYAFCILRRDDVEIFLQQLDGYRKPDVYQQRCGGVWDAYIRSEGVRDLFNTISTMVGVKLIVPLHLQPYGQWEFEIADPNGYVLVFAEPS
jgi:hypothetical protein